MSEDFWIGKTVGGRYEIRSLLGRGGMSTVYHGYDPNLRRDIAVKLIHSHLSDNPEFVRRFQEEASAVAKFRHPNIVQVYDFNNDGKTYYIIFELVDGETLQEMLQALHARGEYLPQSSAAAITAQVADALAYAHKRGIVHRDIKPGNVMLNQDGNVILTDFGLAKIVGGTQHTAAGAVLGTMRYISPEQIKSSPIDGRSDIYSLGVMLYEMVSNQVPFNAESAMTMMMMHLNDPVPPLYDLRPDIAPDLVDIIDRAMAKEADDRFQTASEMAAALRNVAFDPSEASATGAPIAATAILADAPLESTAVTPPIEETPSESKRIVAEPVKTASISAESKTKAKPAPVPAQAPPPQKRSRRGLMFVAILVLAAVVVGALFVSGVFDGSVDEPDAVAVADSEERAVADVVATDSPEPEPTATNESVAASAEDEPEPTATNPPEPTATNTPESTNTPEPDDPVDLLADGVEVNDDEYGLSLLIPSDWSRDDDNGAGVFAFASDPALLEPDTIYDDGLYVEIRATPNEDGLAAEDLTGWLDRYIEDEFDAETFDTLIIDEPERVESEEGVDAAQARLLVDFNGDNIDDDVTLTTLLKDDQQLVVFAVASAENGDQWTDVHAAIVESITMDGSIPVLAADVEESGADDTASSPTTTSGPVVAAGSGLPLDFEGSGSWVVGTQKNGALTLSSENAYSGSKSGKIDYAFESDSSDFVLFLQENPISDRANALCLRVFGTGDSGARHFLNAWIRDADGQTWQVPFGQVSHSGWLEMAANLDGERDWPFVTVDESIKDNDAEITYPITFRGLALDDAPDTFNGTGTIYVDDLRSCNVAAATPAATPVVDATVVPTATATTAAPLSLSVGGRSIESDPEQPELYTVTVFLEAAGGSGGYVFYLDNLDSTATSEPQLSFAARCGNDAPHSIQVEDASGNRISIDYTVTRGDLPCG